MSWGNMVLWAAIPGIYLPKYKTLNHMSKREFNYNSKDSDDLDVHLLESDGFQLVIVIIVTICIISNFIK